MLWSARERIGQRHATGGYRLCVVSDATEFGGAEQCLRNLLSGLPKEVDIVALGTSRDVMHQIAGDLPRCHTAVVPDTIAGFRRALVRAAPDVVHLNLVSFTSCRPAGVAAILQRLCVVVVVVDHGPAPGLTWRGRVLQRLLTRMSSARIAPGEGAARNAERYGGLRKGSVLSVPNGVPSPGCSAVSRHEGPLVLGALARLEEEKGLDILIRALVNMPGVTAIIAGDGSQRSRLSQLAKDLDVDGRVRFLGWISSPCALFADTNVLVAPSRAEAMPLAVLEAMHVGLPTVVTDVGSLRDAVLDGETGLLVPPEDPRALARACLRLATDPALRVKMGAAAQIRAARDFSVESMAARYDAHYRAVLGLSSRPSDLGD